LEIPRPYLILFITTHCMYHRPANSYVQQLTATKQL
jgi:hypothetical protein